MNERQGSRESSNLMTGQFHDVDNIMAGLRQEFIVDCSDMLEGLFARLEADRTGHRSDTVELLKSLLRDTHTLKGQGGSFDLPSITMIAHRLEDYLVGIGALESHHIVDTQKFISAMMRILESGVDPGDADCSQILRGLPAKGSAKADFLPESNYEVMLVASTTVLGRAVEQILNSRGLRVVVLKSPLNAFETAIRSRPDLVIASALMEGISGIDLARAFSSMEATRDIPFALLTSFDRANTELKGLPDAVPTIRHDQDVDGQIGEMLDRMDAA
jgi:CheY-like chemotaxis protein/HPt (histidine-containing phosphotransfer) domain-containing protein